ncbi:Cell division cycle protein 27 like [Pseudolycoriella hygida]|uniref:Cell division cycle protein 27 homolog n=1 Tax=Pseudolycoriella hygida TaxID=35572 RepID=A0A9Q0S3D8_9DIPT|nr:Cell division cycle protein 27 like [Pseudolycoriella hygida]
MIVQEPVQAAIWHCLNHYAYEDATFLAERLYAEVDTDDTLFTLATCYYRSNQLHQAFWVLHTKASKSPQCRYLLAKCAFELKKFCDVESALISQNFIELKHLDEICKDFGEVACFALQLVSKVCSQTERHTIAAEANNRALKLNPFLWHSFADLCNRGQKPDPKAIFQFSSTDIFATCQSNSNLSSVVLLGSGVNDASDINLIDLHSVNSDPPLNITPTLRAMDDSPPNDPILNCDYATPLRKQYPYLSTINTTTPSFGALTVLNSSTESQILYNTPPNQQQTLVDANDQKSVIKKIKTVGNFVNRKDTPLQVSKPLFGQTGNITPRTPNPNSMGGQVRRSSRLSFSNCSVKENNKSPNINKFVAPRSPTRRTKRVTKMNLSNTALNEINDKQQKIEKEKIETVTSAETKVLINNSINTAQNMAQEVLQMKKHSAEGLINLLRDLGEGYLQLSLFNCKEAIEAFRNVPPQQLCSSWVQSMIAQAYYEDRNYEASTKIFREIHKKEPHRIHLMEVYSSGLWHLQREVELSTLAQDLVAQDKLSPVTWCTLGNCFSLHKEHETAIKFLERAIQVDPEYSYAYILLGHELAVTEELEKALSCYRSALVKNSHQYNAWYGIGTIYHKQERYGLAEYHYKAALRINSRCPVLMVHIGTMQFYLKKCDQALQTLNAAIALHPRNPLCKFHRGSLNFHMGKYPEALKELEELKRDVPKESIVYYLLGKIHKKMGNVDAAIMHFSWATDLDPKGANNQIKEAFDSNIGQSTVGAADPSDLLERNDESTQLGSREPNEAVYDSDKRRESSAEDLMATREVN